MGTYGQIRLAVHEIVNEKVAVKIIEKRHLTTNWDLHAIQNEINLLRYVIHPNVIHLYEVHSPPHHKDTGNQDQALSRHGVR